MKAILALIFALPLSAAASECKPNININCCAQQPAPTPKPRVITRTKVVEKIVEKPVPVYVDREKIKVVEKKVPVAVIRTVHKKTIQKNRVSLLGGAGPARISTTATQAQLERDVVVGAQYQRMLGESLSLGLQLQSNETVLGSIGLDF